MTHRHRDAAPWTSAAHTAAPTRIILVRHGEPDESARGRCCGRLDPRLSALGAVQMKYAASILERHRVGILYSSPLRRAVESARILAPQAELRIDDRLSEISFGALEGLTYEEAAVRYPEVYRTWMERPGYASFPRGESVTVMRARVLGAFADLLRKHRSQSIAVVAHAGVNRIALAQALDLARRSLFRLAQDYGAVNIIEYHHDARAIVTLMNAALTAEAPPC